jgi:hypothetical protein
LPFVELDVLLHQIRSDLVRLKTEVVAWPQLIRPAQRRDVMRAPKRGRKPRNRICVRNKVPKAMAIAP